MPASESSGIDKLPDRVLVYARVKSASPSLARSLHAASITMPRTSPRDGKSFRASGESERGGREDIMDRCPGLDPRSMMFTRPPARPCWTQSFADVTAPSGTARRGAAKHGLLNLGDGGGPFVPRLRSTSYPHRGLDAQYDVEIAMMQIYNETVMDLLKPNDMKRTPGNSERGLRACQRKAQRRRLGTWTARGTGVNRLSIS